MPETVLLKGGVSLPADVIKLAWRLEDAGCTFRLDGDDLVIRPARLVSPDDRALIRQWRDDLVRLVRYIDDPPAIPV